MRIRQFMSIEPIASIGAEQQEAGGFGDPIIRPVFGDIYYLPNDESIYLLLKNDNLEIYTKNWIPLKNKMSFMKYLIIRFNCEQFCLDLDNFKFVKFDMQKINNCEGEYINYIPNISNLRIETKNLHKNIQDFSTGKNFKVTKNGKQMQLYFKLENYEIVLQIITDLSYKDIRNTSFIKFIGNITTNDIMNMSGAFIQESKCKKIRDNKLKINKIYA
jgi:hypothetical protein